MNNWMRCMTLSTFNGEDGDKVVLAVKVVTPSV